MRRNAWLRFLNLLQIHQGRTLKSMKVYRFPGKAFLQKEDSFLMSSGSFGNVRLSGKSRSLALAERLQVIIVHE